MLTGRVMALHAFGRMLQSIVNIDVVYLARGAGRGRGGKRTGGQITGDACASGRERAVETAGGNGIREGGSAAPLWYERRIRRLCMNLADYAAEIGGACGHSSGGLNTIRIN